LECGIHKTITVKLLCRDSIKYRCEVKLVWNVAYTKQSPSNFYVETQSNIGVKLN